jgi:hypothetical protein
MASFITASRLSRGLPLLSPAKTAERRVRRRVALAWGLLFFTAPTFYSGISFLHIPSIVGKGVAQAVLTAALLVALSLNRLLLVRPEKGDSLCLQKLRQEDVCSPPLWLYWLCWL